MSELNRWGKMLRLVLFLLFAGVLNAGIALVRKPVVITAATEQDCAFVAHQIAAVANRHGLKDRSFQASDPRTFAIFESSGRLTARLDGERIVVRFDFDARDHELCDAIRREVRECFNERFGARIEP